MIPGKIVGCEHSKNGVCSACQAALNMPGQFITCRARHPAGPSPRADPGRCPRRPDPDGDLRPRHGHGRAGPGGVVPGQLLAGWWPRGDAGHLRPPGHAARSGGGPVVELRQQRPLSGPRAGRSPTPTSSATSSAGRTSGAEKKEEKAWKKAEAHASIAYDQNGNWNNAPVEELPASTVFGKKGPSADLTHRYHSVDEHNPSRTPPFHATEGAGSSRFSSSLATIQPI